MTGPGQGARLLLTVFLAAWVMVYCYSLFGLPALFAARAAVGGLDLSQAVHFLGWQGVAAVIAFAVNGVSRLWPRGSSTRQLGGLPLLLALLLVAVLAAMVLRDSLR